jgi:hypothetical protein
MAAAGDHAGVMSLQITGIILKDLTYLDNAFREFKIYRE